MTDPHGNDSPLDRTHVQGYHIAKPPGSAGNMRRGDCPWGPSTGSNMNEPHPSTPRSLFDPREGCLRVTTPTTSIRRRRSPSSTSHSGSRDHEEVDASEPATGRSTAPEKNQGYLVRCAQRYREIDPTKAAPPATAPRTADDSCGQHSGKEYVTVGRWDNAAKPPRQDLSHLLPPRLSAASQRMKTTGRPTRPIWGREEGWGAGACHPEGVGRQGSRAQAGMELAPSAGHQQKEGLPHELVRQIASQ